MLFCKNGVRVLAIGAHPDDIEIGAGGFLFRLIEERGAVVRFLTMTPGIQHATSGQLYAPVSRREEAIRAAKQLKIPAEFVTVLDHEDCNLHNCGHKLIHAIESTLYDKQGKANFDLI